MERVKEVGIEEAGGLNERRERSIENPMKYTIPLKFRCPFPTWAMCISMWCFVTQVVEIGRITLNILEIEAFASRVDWVKANQSIRIAERSQKVLLSPL